MFKYYTTFDIISEINAQILRSEYSIQVLVDKNDLFLLSDSLLKLLNKSIEVEIIIVSNSYRKSLRIINLVKRLINGGFSLYWCTDYSSSDDSIGFGIFDKVFLIALPSDALDEDNPVEVIRSSNVLFKSILLKSEKIELLSGDIHIAFSASNTMLQKNESFELSWSVKNAHHVSIEPLLGDVALEGSKMLYLKEDETFTIRALNKETSISKILFVKVFEDEEIDFTVSVFDTILDQYIKIEPSMLNEGNYAVYYGQTVKVSWDIKMIGKLHEHTLGILPLSGFHEAKIMEDTELVFTFNTIGDTQMKKLIFHSFDDAHMDTAIENVMVAENVSNNSEETGSFTERVRRTKDFIFQILKRNR